VLAWLAALLRDAAAQAPAATAWGAGALVAVASNLVNNLPSGLIAGAAVHDAGVSETVAGAILIGVDLGPNLSVTGSLATILWLTAIRREGQDVSAWRFLKLGLVVMPPALVLALAGLILV
jgi:arsenical pump membrane protein